GAGRRRGAAGAAVRRCRRQGHRRFLRGARRQDGTARARRRARDRARPLAAEAVTVDATEWQGQESGNSNGGFDGILIDAPCTSTGTIRRHPDVAWLRQESDIAGLSTLQQRLLRKSVSLLKPGGMLVYCTCSLEPEEGEQAI